MLAVIAVAAGLGGCAATPLTDSLTASPPEGLPLRAELTATPFYPQTEYHCGPAALATVLDADGVAFGLGALTDKVYTPGRTGTLKTEIKTGARRMGRLALPVRDMETAFRHVADGRPVLLLQNLSLQIAPQWHYAVLIGFDLEAGTAVLRSGTTKRKIMKIETLEHTWRRSGFWGVLIADPTGPVPSGTHLGDWMRETVGLERAERADDALTSYRTAGTHWSNDAAPMIAAANVHLDAGRLNTATAALRVALRRSPGDPVALNNLAHVPMLLGDLNTAAMLARRAQDNGGSKIATATLAEIKAIWGAD